MVGKSGVGNIKSAEAAVRQFEVLADFLEHPEKLKEVRKAIDDLNEASERAGVTTDLNRARNEAKALVETAKKEAERLKTESVNQVREAEKQAKRMLDEIRTRQTDHTKAVAKQTAELDATAAALDDRKADLDKWESDLRDKSDNLKAREQHIVKEEARLRDWANRMKAASSV